MTSDEGPRDITVYYRDGRVDRLTNLSPELARELEPMNEESPLITCVESVPSVGEAESTPAEGVPDRDELKTAEDLLRRCKAVILARRQDDADGQADWESGDAWNDLVRLVALALRRTSASKVLECAVGAASARDPIKVLATRLWKILKAHGRE